MKYTIEFSVTSSAKSKPPGQHLTMANMLAMGTMPLPGVDLNFRPSNVTAERQCHEAYAITWVTRKR